MDKMKILALAALVLVSCREDAGVQYKPAGNSAEATAVATNANKGNGDPYLISKGEAGNIMLGMPINDMLAGLPEHRVKKVEAVNEGQLSTNYRVYDDERDNLLVVEPGTGNTVSRIIVTDERLKTEKGIGVDSEYGALLANYRVDRIIVGEGNVVARVEEIGASFELGRSNIPQTWYKDQKKEEMPPYVRISKVILSKAP